jgi:hypothetical protein
MAASTNFTVSAVCRDFRSARTTVDVLRSFGFPDADILVLFSEQALEKPRLGHYGIQQCIDLFTRNAGWATYVEAAGFCLVFKGTVELGLPRADAQAYEDFLRCGEFLVIVRARSEAASDRAEGILRRTGAQHITRARDVASLGEEILNSISGNANKIGARIRP